MAYQMTVTLTDQEYQVLAAETARRGEEPETLLRDLIRIYNQLLQKEAR